MCFVVFGRIICCPAEVHVYVKVFVLEYKKEETFDLRHVKGRLSNITATLFSLLDFFEPV